MKNLILLSSCLMLLHGCATNKIPSNCTQSESLELTLFSGCVTAASGEVGDCLNAALELSVICYDPTMVN